MYVVIIIRWAEVTGCWLRGHNVVWHEMCQSDMSWCEPYCGQSSTCWRWCESNCGLCRVQHAGNAGQHGGQQQPGGAVPAGVHRHPHAHHPWPQPEPAPHHGGAGHHLHLQVAADEVCALCPAGHPSLPLCHPLRRQQLQRGGCWQGWSGWVLTGLVRVGVDWAGHSGCWLGWSGWVLTGLVRVGVDGWSGWVLTGLVIVGVDWAG